MYQNYVFLLELFWEFDLLELIHMAEILLLKPESINQSINQLISSSVGISNGVSLCLRRYIMLMCIATGRPEKIMIEYVSDVKFPAREYFARSYGYFIIHDERLQNLGLCSAPITS